VKVKEGIDECHHLLEKGGDWERKNKLKVFEGIYNLIVRDFKAASVLFVDVLPTFNCPEVMSYETLVLYSVLTGIISMDRQSIKKKIIDSSEVIMALIKMPEIKEYLESFYYCRYKQFFHHFLWVIDEVRKDKYLNSHHRYFIR
jgi:26S proteasome regulatory subunit N7